MPEEVSGRHPILEMLDDNEPEAIEYWLSDDGLAKIYEDFEAGRINGPTYQSRLQAWIGAWRKRLEDWRSTLPEDADAHLLTTNVWARPGIPADNDRNGVTEHLKPQKVRAKPRGPMR